MEKIELSLSPKYVTNWGLKEAIREILQNAIDCETDGYKVDVTYYSERLTIRTEGTTLPKHTLLLGESGKSDNKYVGKYGEGYKLALLVLTRLGKETMIFTNGEKWTPIFEVSEVFGEQSMKMLIEESDAYAPENVVFEIKGIKQHEMASFRTLFIALEKFLGRSVGATRQGEYGTVLLSEEFKGKFYVNGLYVQTDTEFNYGYDFKSEYVELDRDRKAINYYDLKELTAKTLTSTGDVELIRDGLERKIVDLSDEDEVLDELSEEQSVNFKKNYYEKHKLEPETFVGTNKMIEISGEKKTKQENEIITKIIFKADNKEDEYEEYKKKIKDKNDYQSAVNSFNQSSYKKLYIWFKENEKRLTKKAIFDFKIILENDVSKPYGFDLIKDKIDEIIEEENKNVK